MSWSNQSSLFRVSYISGSLFLVCTIVFAAILIQMKFRTETKTLTRVFPQIEIGEMSSCDGLDFCSSLTSESPCNQKLGCNFADNACQMVPAKDLCSRSFNQSEEFCQPWHVATRCMLHTNEDCLQDENCAVVDSVCVSSHDACASTLKPAGDGDCISFGDGNVQVDKCFVLPETDCANDDDCRFADNVCMRKSCCLDSDCRVFTESRLEPNQRNLLSKNFENNSDFTDNIFNTASMLFVDCENCNSAYSFFVWLFWISLFLFLMCLACCVSVV